MPTYTEVRKRYSEYLQEAYLHAKKLKTGISSSFDCSHIDRQTLETWETTWKPCITPGMPGGWDWTGLWQKYKRKTAKYFDLAIWSSQTLCGLAIGKPSRSNSHCTIYNIEGNPEAHPLKGLIIPLVIDVSESYTAIIGGYSVRFADPDMQLKEYYERLGFKLCLHRKAKVRYKRNEVDYIYDGESYYERRL